MKTCCVLVVCLTLVGSASSVLGELPPLLTQASEQRFIDFVPSPPKAGLPASGARLAATSKLSTPRSTEERKLDYGRLERRLAALFPNSKVYLIPMAFKDIVRGQCPNEDEVATILKIIRDAVVELEPVGWETPFILDGSEPAVLTLNDIVRLKRNDLAAACILNELRVDAIVSDAHEVPPVPSHDVMPVSTTPYSTRSLPPLLHNLLSADSCRAMPVWCPSDLPRAVTGPPSYIAVPHPLTAVPTFEPVSPSAPDADPFQSHLTRAEDQLRAAGLTDEAHQLQAMHQMFSAQHQGTLLIARKEAQLSVLQSEIALLKRTTVSNTTQVSLRVRLVEIAKSDETWKAIGPLLGDDRLTDPQSPARIAGTFRGVLNGDEIHRLLDHLCRSGAVKIVSEPQMTVLNGRQCRFVSGGEVPVPSVVGVGGAQDTAYRSFGTSIEACPRVAGDRIRLSIKAESTRQEEAVQQAGTHPTSSRRITTCVEMRSGQTLFLRGLYSRRPSAVVEPKTRGAFSQVGQLISELTRSDREETELLVVITPEIVIPLGPYEIPPFFSVPVPGFEVTRPNPYTPVPVPVIDMTLEGNTVPQPR